MWRESGPYLLSQAVTETMRAAVAPDPESSAGSSFTSLTFCTRVVRKTGG
jgi:hypothetical protein